MHNFKKVSFEERSCIQLLFSKPVSIRTLLDEIHIWQTFISLGLGRPCHIDKINPLFEVNNGSFYNMDLIVPGRVAEERPERNTHAGDKLFTQSKLGKNLGRLVKGWRTAHETLEVPVLLYSGTTFQKSGYSHANLLTYLQALEVLHREKFKEDKFPNAASRKLTMKALKKAVPTSLDQKLQEDIKGQLAHIGSMTFLDRLNQLYGLHHEVILEIFPDKENNMKELKNVRNYLTHYGSNKTFNTKSLWKYDMYALMSKTRIFLEVCLLAAMKMSNAEISELMNSYENFGNWKFESRWNKN